MNIGALLAYFSEACMVASAICLIVGWVHIRAHRVHSHRRWMLATTYLAATFFVTYVVHSLWIGDTSFTGPKGIAPFYQVFLQTHATLATVAGILGVITLRRALRRRFTAHRRLAPWTAVLWLIAAGSGLVVFLLLYVVFRPGIPVNMLRAVVGHSG